MILAWPRQFSRLSGVHCGLVRAIHRRVIPLNERAKFIPRGDTPNIRCVSSVNAEKGASGHEDQRKTRAWGRTSLIIALPLFSLCIWRAHCRGRFQETFNHDTRSFADAPSFDDSCEPVLTIDDLVTEDEHNLSQECGDSQSSNEGYEERNKHRDEEDYYQSSDESGMAVFSCTSNVELAREVCAHLNLSLSRLHLGRFADGEISVKILDDVRSRDVYVFQSVPAGSDHKNLHSQFMELFLTVSALRRASSERITAVIPYLGYSRQNEVDPVNPKPLAVADISNILYTLGVDRVVYVDHHAPRAAAFFPEPLPVTNVSPHRLAIRYLTKMNLKSPVVVATENTGTERAKLFWSRLKKHVDDTGLATMVSNRPRSFPEANDDREYTDSDSYTNVDGVDFSEGQEKNFFIGDVRDRDCVIVDNIVDSGIKVSSVANACRAAGARRIFVYVTHGILSKGAIGRLDNCEAEEILLTNTIELPAGACSNKIRVLNISKLLAEVLRRLHAEALPDFIHNSNQGVGELYAEIDFEVNQIEESHNN